MREINNKIWLHGTKKRFEEYRDSSESFLGSNGVFLTLDRDLAEHYGSVILENVVSVKKTIDA